MFMVLRIRRLSIHLAPHDSMHGLWMKARDAWPWRRKDTYVQMYKKNFISYFYLVLHIF